MRMERVKIKDDLEVGSWIGIVRDEANNRIVL